ncbi:MAG: YigZ family protein [Suipraeoptans sp.]
MGNEKIKITYTRATAEIEVKKSKFIASVYPIKSEEEAQDFINKKKKECWNAAHNCYAYVVGERMKIQRFSDDGEPGGTAGKPILDILLGEEIHNTLIIVTRYFGGTLLGTGGLIRAYASAAKEGLANSEIIEKRKGILIRLSLEYTDVGKVQYIIGNASIPILKTVYESDIAMELYLSEQESKELMDEIVESTAGRVKWDIIEECWFGIFKNERREV